MKFSYLISVIDEYEPTAEELELIQEMVDRNDYETMEDAARGYVESIHPSIDSDDIYITRII